MAQITAVAAPAAASTATANPAQFPPMNGIAHIAIKVQSIADSLAFYGKLGYQQAFANTSANGTVTQSFLKLNDKQYIELYPAGPAGAPAAASAPGSAQNSTSFMHLCFEGSDLNGLHDDYVAEGLTPISVRTAAAGNLLFTLKGPQQPTSAQNIEYTQYMPTSRHTMDIGQHLSPDRVADKMLSVTLAMQDPAAARDFYVTKLGFKPDTKDKGRGDFLMLPGTSGQMVEIVPVTPLGGRSKILMTTPDIRHTATLLKAKGVAFTDGDTLSVTDPDGNIIEIIPQR